MSNYEVARIEEIEDVDYREDTPLRPVRHHLGITAFGTNGWTAANVGDRLMPEHEEDPGNEELYVVLRGRARFEIDGDTVDAPAGTLVFVPPGEQPDRLRGGGRARPCSRSAAPSGSRTRPAAGRSGRSSIPRTRPATTRR